MYWYKQFNTICILLTVLFTSGLYSCAPDVKDKPGFYDLKGFFYADSARLTKKDPLVTKITEHNGYKEARKLHIMNWGSELSLFTASDINKPSWRGNYKVTKRANTIIYKAIHPEMKTREIVIDKQGDHIRSITISNQTRNILYTSNEKLFYYPDSLYRIIKTQHVRLMGTNVYKITGKFN